MCILTSESLDQIQSFEYVSLYWISKVETEYIQGVC